MDDTTCMRLVFALALASISSVSSDSCTSYCDEEGYFQNGFDCDSSHQPYCCGDAHDRFCCNNQSLEITYPPVYVCDKSSWWIFHWQIAIGMVAVVILILILAACCCQCCVNKSNRRHRQMASERRRGRSRGRHAEDQMPRPPSFFSPEHPFAFTPPEYDSLPKDPPSYTELSGQDNPGFLMPPPDALGEMARSPSLPSYTSQIDNFNTDPRRISDATLPPYSSRNVSRANTPNLSRRSSIQSGIVLDLSRRSSNNSSRFHPHSVNVLPSKAKEAIPSPQQQSEGQMPSNSQQQQQPTEVVPSVEVSSANEVGTSAPVHCPPAGVAPAIEVLTAVVISSAFAVAPATVSAVEDVPPAEVSPAGEASPAVEVSPSTEVSPAIEVSPAVGVSPAIEVSPADEVSPAIEVSPAVEISPVTEVIPATDDGPQIVESQSQNTHVLTESSSAEQNASVPANTSM